MQEEQSQKQELLSAASKGQHRRGVEQWGFMNSIYPYSEQWKRNDGSSTLVQSSGWNKKEMNSILLTHLEGSQSRSEFGTEEKFSEIHTLYKSDKKR